MRQELASNTTEAGSPTEADPIWEALVDCPITINMSKLLNLVPRFRQAMEARLQTPHKTIPALLTETNLGPTIIDHQNPAIKVLVHDTEIQGCVVDSGSGVNVISKATCTNLGLLFVAVDRSLFIGHRFPPIFSSICARTRRFRLRARL